MKPNPLSARIVRIVPVISTPPTFSFASRVADGHRLRLPPLSARGEDRAGRAHGPLPLPSNDARCAGLPATRACVHRSTCAATSAWSAGPQSASLRRPPRDLRRRLSSVRRVVRPERRAPCQRHRVDPTTLSAGLAAVSLRREDSPCPFLMRFQSGVLSLALTSADDGPGRGENQAAESRLQSHLLYVILEQMAMIPLLNR